MLHGNISSGHNRWFDKSIQLIVTNNGKAGLVGEHSMMDGMPVVALANQLTATTHAIAKQRSATVTESINTGGVQNLFETVNPSLEASDVPEAVDEGTKLFFM